MNDSNSGSSKVPSGQAPGGNTNQMPLTGARVVKSAASNLTPKEAPNRGKNPYAGKGGM